MTDSEIATTAAAAPAKTNTDQQMIERAHNALADMYDTGAREVVDKWCADHHFALKSLASEHVINLEHILPPAPAVSNEPAPSASRTGRDASSAEHIFNVAMGIESETAVPQRHYASKPRCDICADLMRHSRTVELRCEYQQLLLCPDCILARCCDNTANESVLNYIVIYYVATDCPPVLNTVGKWTFDYIQRIKFDRTTLEGFIAFRTFVIYNVARVCPPVATSEPISPASPVAGAKGSPDARKSPGAASKIFKLMHVRTKDREMMAATAATSTTATTSATTATSTSMATMAPVDPSYFIIRRRLRDGISLATSRTFTEAMAIARPIPCDATTTDELERAVLSIFAQEPRQVYCNAMFCPASQPMMSRRADDDRAIFNYWRGWQWRIVPSAGEINNDLIRPVLTFINEVWCANLMPPANTRDLLDVNARFVISWFAQIIQQPGTPPERQMVLRGFAPELVLPLLRFIGRNVIGCQYFDESLTPAPQSIANARQDCLFALIDGCNMKDLKPVARECRALWQKSESSRKMTFAERARKAREASQRAIDTKKIISHDPEAHRLMRAAICVRGSEPLPIERSRRRFGVIDKSRAVDAIVDMRLRQLNEALTHEDMSEQLFRFFAQFQPLTLYWD